ncbi:MAG: GNAT family N-acetyltransferase [Planctomycetes bacterium]|nr:GNAT family N-acetyltransferase [Planctomycetota bacterium]
MTSTITNLFRELGGPDRRRVLALARAAGLHGVYLRNALDAGGDDDLLGAESLAGSGALGAVAWQGRRGNLVVIAGPGFGGDDALDFARAIVARWSAWRIALGPADVVAELARCGDRPTLVHRTQVYYGFDATQVCREHLRDDVRAAQRQDVRALVHAALELNQSDLNVAAWRVHRGWLRDSVRRRIREHRTFVIGPPGEPLCKLDVGSRGSAGAVIEGVYTLPEARGQGLATGLVATVGAWFGAEHPIVSLHCAEDNAPARRAYEAAGMRLAGDCALLLRG